MKKIKGRNVDIKLEKREVNWVLSIGENSSIVRSIDDMIKMLRELSPIINSF